MNLLQNWVETPGATALVWTLIHSLWEGALVALLLAAALSVLRGSRARYAAACIALLVLLAGFGLTFANLLARQESLSAARCGLRRSTRMPGICPRFGAREASPSTCHGLLPSGSRAC